MEKAAYSKLYQPAGDLRLSRLDGGFHYWFRFSWSLRFNRRREKSSRYEIGGRKTKEHVSVVRSERISRIRTQQQFNFHPCVCSMATVHGIVSAPFSPRPASARQWQKLFTLRSSFVCFHLFYPLPSSPLFIRLSGAFFLSLTLLISFFCRTKHSQYIFLRNVSFHTVSCLIFYYEWWRNGKCIMYAQCVGSQQNGSDGSSSTESNPRERKRARNRAFQWIK